MATERDLIRYRRAQVARDAGEYLNQWRDRELVEIDSAAGEAMDEGMLQDKAMALWVRRLEILRIFDSISKDVRAGKAVAEKKDLTSA